MTTLFEMAAALTRADAAMVNAGVDVRTRLTVLDTISQATIATELDLPDWRREELARKYAPVDAYEPDDVSDESEPEDPTPYCSYGHRTQAQCDCGPIADNE